MKNRILICVLAGVFLVISACGEQEPTSAPTDLDPSLHTAPVDFLAKVNANFPFENPGCMSVEDGTLVFDGCMRPNSIKGDLVGLGSAVLDGEIDLATGNGETEGRITFGTDATPACLANGDCGIFEDEFEGDVIGGRFFGEFEIEGISGDVEGVNIEGTDVEMGPGTVIFILDGTIRFPN